MSARWTGANTAHDDTPEVTRVARDLTAITELAADLEDQATHTPGNGTQMPGGDAGLPETFWAKVEKTETCWNWIGARTKGGYGVFGVKRRMHLAHRLAYQAFVGLIPPGNPVNHKCRNRACVNPAHLQVTTHALNSQNRSGPPSNNTSGVMGVHWAPDHKKWRASVRLNGKRHYAGYYADIGAAEQAVIALRNRLYSNNLRDRQETL